MNLPPSNPIFLSTSVTMTPGSMATPDTDALTNQSQKAMLIDEVRFSISSNLLASITQTNWFGSLIRVQLDVGVYEICKDLIPIWSFARATDTRNELNPNSGFSQAIADSAQFFRWMPANPIYVPVGTAIMPKFQFFDPQAATDFSSMEVSIGYAGRELAEPLSGSMRIPWVGAFIRDDLSVTAFDVISNERDLQNPYTDKLLDVHRFSFRAYAQNGNAEGELTPNCNVRLYDGSNNQVLERLQLGVGAFAIPHRIWDTPGVQLAPRDWYVAEVSLNATVSAEDCGIALAMFGSREEMF